ncbi:MAG: tetratricopeptide repeat protein [Myxococcota bacterium]|nr:tetratricopeptide repeat protein [Myxococcota bacterium]
MLALSTMCEAGQAFAQRDRRRLERLLATAERLATRGHRDEAVRWLERAAAADPADARAPMRLASLLLGPEETEIDPRPAGETVARARALAERLGTTITASSESTSSEASRALVRARARALAVAAALEEAIALVTRGAHRLDEADWRLLRRLAVVAIRRDELGAAERALEAARTSGDVSVETARDLAAVRLAQGRAGDALALLRELAARLPDDVELARDLAGAALAAGQAREAHARFAALAAAEPDDPDAWLDAARAALEAERPASAEAHARRALSVAAPHDPEPALLLGTALRLLGRRAEAVAAYRDALARDPTSARARQALEALDAPLPPTDRRP